jgi:hypothetical protein
MEAFSLLTRTVEAERLELADWHFGSAAGEPVTAAVVDLSRLGKEFGVRIDAAIGLDALGARSFTIDYAARTLTFGPVQMQGPEAALEFGNEAGAPYAMLTVEVVTAGTESHRVRMLFDTGTDAVQLFAVKDAGWLAELPSRGVVSGVSVGGKESLKQVALEKVSLPGGDFGGRVAMVSRPMAGARRDFDGLLGPAALGMRRIGIDLERQVFLWER